MSNTPSNEDIDLLVRAYLGDCGPQANRVYSFVTAVLAKWGTPAPVGMELAAFLVCTEEGDPDMVFLDRHEAQQYLEDDEQPIPLYRPTQPTQPEE